MLMREAAGWLLAKTGGHQRGRVRPRDPRGARLLRGTCLSPFPNPLLFVPLTHSLVAPDAWRYLSLSLAPSPLLFLPLSHSFPPPHPSLTPSCEVALACTMSLCFGVLLFLCVCVCQHLDAGERERVEVYVPRE